MAIKITVDGNTYEGVDVITVGGKVLTLAYVEDSTGGDTGGDSGGTTAKTYTITNNLTNCTNSNKATSVQEGTAYSGAITPDSGYELQSVTVTMGGSPVSASSGIFGIPAVTGNIVITAVAVEISTGGGDGGEVENNGWVDGQPYEIEWTEGYSLDTTTGADKEETGFCVTDYLPCHGADALSYSNVYSGYNFYIYDENKTFLKKQNTQYHNDYVPVPLDGYYVRAIKRTSHSNASVTPHILPTLNESTVYELDKYYSLEWEYGKQIDANTGVESSYTSTTRNVSTYAFCLGASTINIENPQRSLFAFYDTNKTFISGKIIGITDKTIAIPENAAYFRWDTYGYLDNVNPFVKLS